MRPPISNRRFPWPTRFGLGFLLLVLLTLVGCINYGLSLGYGLTFLLGGVWVLSAAQASRGARRLNLTLTPPSEARAGQDAEFKVAVQSGGAALVQLRLLTNQGASQAVTAAIPATERHVIGVAVRAQGRGLLTVSQVQAFSVDRLGLWRVPLASPAPVSVTVFPTPEVQAPPAPARSIPGVSDGLRRTKGDEEFAGLRPYAPGDSPRQVSWRHVARTGALLTRETDAPQGTVRLLDWADTAGDTESRIARLTAWVTELRHLGLPLALHLPGIEVPAGQGETQARTALTALALYEAPTEFKAPGKTKPVLNAGAMRFTLLALAFAVGAGVLHQPWWVSLVIAALLLHTFLRTQGTLPAIPTWLLGLFAGMGLALLNGVYGTLLGRDAGTALLALLITLKAAESRTVRDGKLLVLLGVFLTSTQYFFSQGPVSALYTLLCAALLLTAAARWVIPAQPAWAALRRTGKFMALAAPLAVILFILYPRPDHPLWQLPLQGGAQTGLSNEIKAGEFSNLAQSSAVAFRADFQGAMPPADQRYWRGPVYENYDGQTWRQMRASGPSPSVELYGPTWTYTLTLEPGNGPWLLALDAPLSVPSTAFRTTAFQAVSLQGAGTRRRVQLQSRPARLGRQENRERLMYDLQLPAGQSPQALALAAPWRNLPPQERVQAALKYLTTHGFTYTLNPPTLPEQNRIDAFLFTSRQGFCEHYASAFAFLMRAAGLPARIVGGYLGGQVNTDGGGYLIVRQQDAHAWTEVWLPNQGWVRVDPTAVIAPARVNAGLSTALNTPQATAAPTPNLWGRMKLRLDALQNRWNDLVVGYDGQQQQAILTRAGLGGVGSGTYLLTFALLTVLALLPALYFLRRPAAPSDPAERALHALTIKLGLPRHAGETLTDYAARVRQERPQLAPALHDILHAYHTARYAPQGQQAALLTLQRAVKQIRRDSR